MEIENRVIFQVDSFVAFSYQIKNGNAKFRIHIPLLPSPFLENKIIDHHLTTFSNALPSVKTVQNKHLFPPLFSEFLGFSDGKERDSFTLSIEINQHNNQEETKIFKSRIKPSLFSPHQLSKVIETVEPSNPLEETLKVLADIAFQQRDLRMREKSEELKPSSFNRLICALYQPTPVQQLPSYKLTPNEAHILSLELYSFTSQKFYQLISSLLLSFPQLTVAPQLLSSNLIHASQFLTLHFPFLLNHLLLHSTSQSHKTTPTQSPNNTPTQSPNITPTQSPNITPTQSPNNTPTQSPNISPTSQSHNNTPTQSHNISPTQSPNISPTQSPNISPTSQSHNITPTPQNSNIKPTNSSQDANHPSIYQTFVSLEEKLFWIKRNTLFETSLYKILDDDRLFCFQLRDWCKSQAKINGIPSLNDVIFFFFYIN